MLDVQYDYPAIAERLTRRSMPKRADYSHWRYRELLPDGARLEEILKNENLAS